MYHLGIDEVITKSALTTANDNCSYRVYADLAIQLIKEAKQLYLGDNELEVRLKEMYLRNFTNYKHII